MQLLPKEDNSVFALVNKFWFLAWQWFWWINRCPPSIPEGLCVMAESDFCGWMNVYVNHFMSVALFLPCSIKIHCSKGFCIMGFWSPSSSIAGSYIYKRNSISHQWHLQHLDAVPSFSNWQWNPLAGETCKCVVCLIYNFKANLSEFWDTTRYHFLIILCRCGVVSWRLLWNPLELLEQSS